MTDRSKQIIPDTEAVARCFDGTFLISDLLANLKMPADSQKIFINDLRKLHLELKQSGYSREYYLDKIEAFLRENTIAGTKNETSKNIFEDDIICTLLEPNGKGWQKGKLKLCFEFIPEEIEHTITREKPAETHQSPLDEIRQLSNELASVGSIEQN
jgi:KGK domain